MMKIGLQSVGSSLDAKGFQMRFILKSCENCGRTFKSRSKRIICLRCTRWLKKKAIEKEKRLALVGTAE